LKKIKKVQNARLSSHYLKKEDEEISLIRNQCVSNVHISLEIRLHPDAAKYLAGLDSAIKERLKARIKELELNPFKSHSSLDIKKLKGTKKRCDLYRLKVGDYRVIYAVENNTVLVFEIIPREKGYSWL
jgi:mRNA interferase RelE/StbE